MLLLIDTCTLLQLVYSEGYSQQLVDLENFVNSNHINLLTHELIIEEWKRNQKDDRNRKLKKLLTKSNKVQNDTTSLLPSPITTTTDHIDSQYAQVDKLLEKAHILKTPEIIKNEFADRYREKLAPLHNKKDGLNDWEIIGSAAHYCELNGISRLYFISYNCTDFGSVDDPERTIHPDLQKRFPKANISYYMDISAFLKDLNTLVAPQRIITRTIVKNEKFTHKASIKKNDLDSLYYLLKDNYEELPFIPLHILRKYHPFANATDAYTYYSVFSMNNVRESLVEMFSQINIDRNKITIVNEQYFSGIADVEKKIKYVLTRLTKNLVFTLGGEKGNKRIDIRFSENEYCNCASCYYYRLQFHKSLPGLKEISDTIDEKVKTAYLNYQYGNYSSAARQFIEIREGARSNSKFMIYYLCSHNLKHLGKLLTNPFYDKSLSAVQTKTLEDIDPLEECVFLKSETDYDFLEFIATGDFFTEAFETISDLVVKIEDHYYSHINGGRGMNSFASQLIQEFATLDSFISNNCLIYDAYSNYDRLFELVVKGLFASHAMRDTDNSSLDSFDDYWIGKFIFYGSKKVFYKYFNRFNLPKLVYKSTSGKKGSFIDVAINLLDNERATFKACSSFIDKGNVHFGDEYQKIFDNVLTLATLLDLKTAELNKLSKHLLKFLKSEASIDQNGYESISNFFKAKGKLIDKKILTDFSIYVLSNFEKYQCDLPQALVNSYRIDTVSGLPYEKILHKALNLKDVHIKHLAFSFILSYHRRAVSKDKTIITDAIKKELRKTSDYRMFYLATIYDVIPLQKSLLYKFLDGIDLTMLKDRPKTIFFREYISQLDDLVNLCFKYNISTRSVRFQKFKNHNLYYKWVLDMENFDYSKFNFEWVNHFQTTYFYKAMNKSKKFKKILTEYLRTHSNSGLEKALIHMSCF